MKSCDMKFRAALCLVVIFLELSLYAVAAVKSDHRCVEVLDGSCTNTGHGRCGLRNEYEKCGPTSGADKAECFYCNNTQTMITSKICLYSPGGSCTMTTETFNCAPDDNGARVGVCNSISASTCKCDNEVLMTGDPRCSQTKTYNGCSG